MFVSDVRKLSNVARIIKKDLRNHHHSINLITNCSYLSGLISIYVCCWYPWGLPAGSWFLLICVWYNWDVFIGQVCINHSPLLILDFLILMNWSRPNIRTYCSWDAIMDTMSTWCIFIMGVIARKVSNQITGNNVQLFLPCSVLEHEPI